MGSLKSGTRLITITVIKLNGFYGVKQKQWVLGIKTTTVIGLVLLFQQHQRQLSFSEKPFLLTLLPKTHLKMNSMIKTPNFFVLVLLTLLMLLEWRMTSAIECFECNELNGEFHRPCPGRIPINHGRNRNVREHSRLRIIHKSAFLFSYHGLYVFKELTLLSATKVSTLNMHRNVINACLNGICQLTWF